MYGLSRTSLLIGAATAAGLYLAMRGLDLVPRAAGATALAGGAAVTALSDLLITGTRPDGIGDRGLLGRVAVAVTAPLAVLLGERGPAWDPALTGSLAFATGIAAGGVAVLVRRRRGSKT